MSLTTYSEETPLRDNQKLYLNLFCIASAVLIVVFGVFAVISPASQASVTFHDEHDVFMDFFNTVYYSLDKDPYTWGNLANHNYLPLTYVLFSPLASLYPDYDTEDISTSYPAREHQALAMACFVFLLLSFVLFFYLLKLKMNCGRKYKVFLTAVLFLSSPIIYCIDRANTIVLAVALTFVFLETYQSERKLYCHCGYVCLAIAAALKIFPALFGVLLLREKKFKDALITVLYGLAFAFFPFFLLKGSVVDNVYGFFCALGEHARAYAGGRFGFTPSFLGYVFLALALVYVFVHKEDDWKLYLVLFLAYFLTSGQQAFYCSIMMFYPVVLFLNAQHHRKTDLVYLLAFVLILTPFQYGFLTSIPKINNYDISNMLCVMMYLWLLGEEPFAIFRRRKENAV